MDGEDVGVDAVEEEGVEELEDDVHGEGEGEGEGDWLAVSLRAWTPACVSGAATMCARDFLFLGVALRFFQSTGRDGDWKRYLVLGHGEEEGSGGMQRKRERGAVWETVLGHF